MEGVEVFSWWLKLFQGVRFFLINCEFVLGGRGI